MEPHHNPNGDRKPFYHVPFRYRTWHTENCVIWTRQWNEARGYGAHCTCGGLDWKQLEQPDSAGESHE